jgi:glycosyltransferase involved in cell wall biosynthesis
MNFMKLLVMIPCFNEEQTLPLVIKSIPPKIQGITTIETLIVDDGSTDKTVQVAKQLGVTHVIHHSSNKGLAKSFETGLQACLAHGADIIVNTDGDNQYPQQEIPRLIEPILEGTAEIVIADRQTGLIDHFSLDKKILQKFGSWVVQLLSGIKVPDAVSGFRAYSAEAARQLNIVTEFSYVIETIIQASKKRIKIASVKVVTNEKTRESRLFKGNWSHVKNSTATIVRVFAMYEPLKTFSFLAGWLLAPGVFLVGRFLYYYFFVSGAGDGKVQSLVLAAVLIIVGFQVFLIGLVADLIRGNRKLIEKGLEKNK